MKLILGNLITIMIREEDFVEISLENDRISYIRPNGTRAIIRIPSAILNNNDVSNKDKREEGQRKDLPAAELAKQTQKDSIAQEQHYRVRKNHKNLAEREKVEDTVTREVIKNTKAQLSTKCSPFKHSDEKTVAETQGFVRNTKSTIVRNSDIKSSIQNQQYVQEAPLIEICTESKKQTQEKDHLKLNLEALYESESEDFEDSEETSKKNHSIQTHAKDQQDAKQDLIKGITANKQESNRLDTTSKEVNSPQKSLFESSGPGLIKKDGSIFEKSSQGSLFGGSSQGSIFKGANQKGESKSLNVSSGSIFGKPNQT